MLKASTSPLLGQTIWVSLARIGTLQLGSAGNSEAMATHLYGALRKCDLTEADIILAVETDLTGVGAAVMNRLTKAAEGKRYRY